VLFSPVALRIRVVDFSHARLSFSRIAHNYRDTPLSFAHVNTKCQWVPIEEINNNKHICIIKMFNYCLINFYHINLVCEKQV